VSEQAPPFERRRQWMQQLTLTVVRLPARGQRCRHASGSWPHPSLPSPFRSLPSPRAFAAVSALSAQTWSLALLWRRWCAL
jgi:hypothetical protein